MVCGFYVYFLWLFRRICSDIERGAKGMMRMNALKSAGKEVERDGLLQSPDKLL